MKSSKIALGTVQFGLNYGISNHRGQISKDEVRKILELANKSGIKLLDTAAAYGEAEQVIGDILAQSRILKFDVITKLKTGINPETIDSEIMKSFQSLKVEKLKAILFHDYNDLVKNPKVVTKLQGYKECGRIEKIGVSLYYPQQAEEVLEQHPYIDIIQFPYSVLDRRFEYLLPDLKKRKIELHARSVFLQGLLFISPDKLSSNLYSARRSLEKLKDISRAEKIHPAAIALCFACQSHWVDQVIIGVSCQQDLRNNLQYESSGVIIDKIKEQLLALEIHSEDILLPFLWK